MIDAVEENFYYVRAALEGLLELECVIAPGLVTDIVFLWRRGSVR
jgi:hypothetical protein